MIPVPSSSPLYTNASVGKSVTNLAIVNIVEVNINVRILLYGDPAISSDQNKTVFDAVLKFFINESEQFE